MGSYPGKSALASGNTVNVAGGVFSTIRGGSSSNFEGASSATNNTVNFSGGTAATIMGGEASVNLIASTATSNSEGNTVVISGGTVSIAVYGGFSNVGDGVARAVNNTVSIEGAPDLSAASLYGGGFSSVGSPVSVDVFTGNTLNVRAAGNTVAGLSNFQFMNFYLPATLGAGSTVLTVTGSAVLGDGAGRSSTVTASTLGGTAPLRLGDSVRLLSAGTLDTSDFTQTQAQGQHGVTLRYLWNLDASGIPNTLSATVAHVEARSEAKSLSEGYLSGTSFLAQGSDFLLGKGLAAARSAVAEGSQNSPEVFAALGYGKVHNQTGSSVAVKGYNLVTGLALGKRLDSGELTGAFFFEYGNGDYNAYNSVSGGKVKGRGDTGYKGIGVLAHYVLSNGMNLEASARTGRVDTDYRSDDLRDANGTRARYDAKSGYTSAHVGVGKDWTLNTQNKLETYLKGIWTRQASDKVRLSTGDRVEFDAIDSKRLRIGARLTHAVSSSVKAYAGLAFDREFDGEARATTNGHQIDAPKLKGNTGIGEIGITSTPSAGKPLFLDFGIQGYAGKREGVTGSLRVNYFF